MAVSRLVSELVPVSVTSRNISSYFLHDQHQKVFFYHTVKSPSGVCLNQSSPTIHCDHMTSQLPSESGSINACL